MIGKAILFAVKVIFYLFLVLLVLGMFGADFFLVILINFVFFLLTGWFSFLHRVLPEVSLNPSAFAFTVICSGLLLWSIQWFGAWLYGHFRSRQTTDSPWPATWPWRWTVGLYCGLWMLFLASMAVTGVAHQLVWMARSDKPIIENRRAREFWEIKSVTRDLQIECEASDWKSSLVRNACEKTLGRNNRRVEPVNERWHVVFIENKVGLTEAVFISYRDPELRRKHGYRRVAPAGTTEGPVDRLPVDIRACSVKAEATAK